MSSDGNAKLKMPPIENFPVRILITGANGFVGRHLVTHLLSDEGFADATIFAATHSMKGDPLPCPQIAGWDGLSVPGKIETLSLDLSDANGIQREMARIKPSHLVHLAARSSGADKDRDSVFEVNVAGTRRLLDAAAELSPFPRALIISTGYVYGDTDPVRPAREEDPIGPLWKYGAYTDSKIEMEAVVRNYPAFAMSTRSFAHTGPGHRTSFALPSFAQQLAKIERGELPPILKVGNLDAKRDMLDVRDVVRAYTLLLKLGRPGQTYNIATGKPHSMREMLNLLRAECTVSTEIEIDPDRLRPADLACSTGNPQTLYLQTEWRPEYNLSTTLRDLLAYFRALGVGH